ncbi:MAG TPA: hypothetical protein IAB52_08320 [Candidatus Scatomonas merdavium]|nr:hypothetical protein [Candidatus Scatomonas merdavium]
MKERIRAFMDDLLKDIPKSRKVLELKEELIGNMEERYEDLIRQGYREEDAFQCAMDSVGDVRELFREFEDAGQEAGSVFGVSENQESRKKRAFIHAVGVTLYIVGFAVWMLIIAVATAMGVEEGMAGLAGFIVMLLFTAVATGMLVYCSSMYPEYRKKDDTVVEEFKEWRSGNAGQKEKKNTINSLIWLVATILYFLLSFGTGAWYITWLIWLIAPCVQMIVNLMMDGQKS